MLQPQVVPLLLDGDDVQYAKFISPAAQVQSKSIAMDGSANNFHKPPPIDTSGLNLNGHAVTPNTAQFPSSPDLGTDLDSDRPSIDSPTTPQHTAPKSALLVPTQSHRKSSPARYTHAFAGGSNGSMETGQRPVAPPLQHRHTLEVPRSSLSRVSKEYQAGSTKTSEDFARPAGSTPRNRRGSLTLVRRITKSINSDQQLDDLTGDEDASRYAERIRQKRASRRRRRQDEDDDRVVVGTKVSEGHINFITAYNMLTGIRFVVSRTNAKIPKGELTEAHFTAANKFSFDITGQELTPAAKYDFKFKDYAPEVFRELRSTFRLDPADYLVSLTAKYILSELGSPGKSGSFFYFSRDYKYIIKTIHHAEHVLLRKVLRKYYAHVKRYPDTLLSQFYGLHRVKMPYGKKIHFVVMNNLFPPHRDIHRTFDLKGSTYGREFKEEELEKHPRATLKDLNWLRRNLHLEFGPIKKRAFIEQMEKDVELLKGLKIMDYSLLVGIHDLEKGNEENLRDRTLKVFEPGSEQDGEGPGPGLLNRSPSKLENARKVKELRQNLKIQKPVPMGSSSSARMPDELPEDMIDKGRNFYFYGDDGGFRATHEDDRPGEEIYYLGIIDCLTKYNFVKRGEHFFKGFTAPEGEISAIPPDRYGKRFVKFINGITVPKELAGDEKAPVEGETLDRERRTTEEDRDGQTLPIVEEESRSRERRAANAREADDWARDGEGGEKAARGLLPQAAVPSAASDSSSRTAGLRSLGILLDDLPVQTPPNNASRMCPAHEHRPTGPRPQRLKAEAGLHHITPPSSLLPFNPPETSSSPPDPSYLVLAALDSSTDKTASPSSGHLRSDSVISPSPASTSKPSLDHRRAHDTVTLQKHRSRRSNGIFIVNCHVPISLPTGIHHPRPRHDADLRQERRRRDNPSHNPLDNHNRRPHDPPPTPLDQHRPANPPSHPRRLHALHARRHPGLPQPPQQRHTPPGSPAPRRLRIHDDVGRLDARPVRVHAEEVGPQKAPLQLQGLQGEAPADRGRVRLLRGQVLQQASHAGVACVQGDGGM